MDTGVLATLLSGSTTRMIWLGLATFAAAIIIPWIYRCIKWYKFYQALPGDPDYSFIYGNLHKLPKTPEARLAYGRYNMETYGPKFSRFWIASFQPVIVVFHPESVKAILKSTAPKSRGFGRVYEMLLPWIGEGLIVSNGATWYRSRRLITPAFHFDILKPYVDIYNTAIDKLVKNLDVYAESGEEFDFYPMILLCTLEIILKCAMSYEVDAQVNGHHPYAEATKEICELFGKRARTPLHWAEKIFKRTAAGRRFFKHCDYVHSVAEEVIQKRKAQLETDGQPKGRLDFIDILLMARDENGQPMTTLEIRNEVDTFMFAGHDTTSSAVSWLLYCLAKHPDYQAKIQEEVDVLLEGRSSQHIQWSDLSEMDTLNLCVKESMRLFPPVPFIQRELSEDTELDGKVIPSGSSITIAIIHLHRNKAVWDDPDEFRPERFTPEQSKGRDSFSYVPFSAGSRNCIGQHFALDEIKVTISRILARFTVELVPGRPEPRRFPKATLESENGIWLKIKHRNKH